MSPNDTLDMLKSTVHPRSHTSLDAIFQICTEQLNRGLSDFSIATIARLGSNRGVPKAQSLRNKTGESYRILIKSFVDCAVPITKKIKLRTKDSWIDEIEDPKLKMLVRIQASELNAAQKLLREIIPPNLEIRVIDGVSKITVEELTDLEREALEYLISKDFLAFHNYQHGSRGDVQNIDGQRVLPIGTFDAVRKALRQL